MKVKKVRKKLNVSGSKMKLHWYSIDEMTTFLKYYNLYILYKKKKTQTRFFFFNRSAQFNNYIFNYLYRIIIIEYLFKY